MTTEEAAMKVATTGTPADDAPAEETKHTRKPKATAKPKAGTPPKRAQVSREPIPGVYCKGEPWCHVERKHLAVNKGWSLCQKATEARHAHEREHGRGAKPE